MQKSFTAVYLAVQEAKAKAGEPCAVHSYSPGHIVAAFADGTPLKRRERVMALHLLESARCAVLRAARDKKKRAAKRAAAGASAALSSEGLDASAPPPAADRPALGSGCLVVFVTPGEEVHRLASGKVLSAEDGVATVVGTRAAGG